MSVTCQKCKKTINNTDYIRIFYPSQTNTDEEMILCLNCNSLFQSYLRNKIVRVRHYTEEDIDNYVNDWLAGD